MPNYKIHTTAYDINYAATCRTTAMTWTCSRCKETMKDRDCAEGCEDRDCPALGGEN